MHRPRVETDSTGVVLICMSLYREQVDGTFLRASKAFFASQFSLQLFRDRLRRVDVVFVQFSFL